MVDIVRVAVPLFLPKLLDYRWAGTGPAQLHTFVEVQVGRQSCHGLVVEVAAESPYQKLKPATPLAGVPPLHLQTAEFYSWVSRYNLAFPGEGLRAALPSGKVPPRPEAPTGYRPTGQLPSRLTPTRQRVLEAAQASPQPLGTTALAGLAGVSAGVVHGLARDGCLQAVPIESTRVPIITRVTLNAEQAHAAQEIGGAMQARAFQPFLLDGITGSGKTEVYFDVIADLLESADDTGQVLVLVPEIALTPQWLQRFADRFGFTPAVWHSTLGQGARYRTWWNVLEGKARVVIGARSALFLPFTDLRLVVVDEEHDSSYKQEDNFRYHGRDMAIVRARLAACPVVLASATPSLETWHHAITGKYRHLTLQSRHGTAVLPTVRVVNLRETPTPRTDEFVAPPLRAAVAERLEKGEQSLLFLNRRGFAPVVICRACGHQVVCPSCSATLVVHGAYLQCHHCGFHEAYPNQCAHCGVADKLVAYGPGTRKILQEVEALWPTARCQVVDRDSVTTPGAMQDVVQRMEAGEIDILIGTQMIAKGHHFPGLTLVGVIDADMGLAHGDLRAAERTFQLLTQVAGRAGRGEVPGEVFLQTHTPEHPLFAALAAMDRDAFFRLELDGRKAGGFPPFGRLVALILSGPEEGAVQLAGQALARSLPVQGQGTLYGPAPAPLARLKDKYRYRLLLQTPLGKQPHGMVQTWLKGTPIPKGVRVDVDVDPQSFF